MRLSPQRLLAAVFVGATFVMTAGPLIDTDLWWHLANGRYIIGHGIPSQDVYSFTAVGHAWVVHEWLTELGMYGLYRLAGLTGLVVVAAALVAVGEWLLYHLLRASGLRTAPAVVMALVLGLAASPSWGARPQLVTFVLTAVLVNLLLLYREGRGGSPLWLVPLFVLWANLHPGFVFGAAVTVLFALTEAIRAGWRRRVTVQVGVAGVIGLCAGLATPAGAATYLAFYKVIASPVQHAINVEWQSPDFHLVPAGPALLVVIVLLVAGALVMAARSRRHPDLTEAGLGLLTLASALSAQRNVALFAVAGAPLVGRCVAALLGSDRASARPERATSTAQAALNWVLLVVLAALALAFRVAPSVAPGALDSAVAQQFPVTALQHLDASRVPGPLFNQYEWGGYITWRDPSRKVFIDGRAEVYGDTILSQYFDVVSLAADTQSVLDRYGVRAILVRSGQPLGRYLAVSGWTQVYHDAVADIYTRAGD